MVPIKLQVLILVDCIYQSIVLTFALTKAQGTKSDLSLNRPGSTQVHHLHMLGSTQVLNVAYPVSRSSALTFQRRTFVKAFFIYGHGGHLGHVT